MSRELLDQLDETIQDLDEAGFGEQAETLYSLGYESTWASDSHMERAVGLELMRMQSRMEGDLPANIVTEMSRCMEIIRRAYPNLSLTEE
jgi:hypothetical protein